MYSKEDYEEFARKEHEFLNQLTEVEASDFATKKGLVLRLIEVTRPRIEAGLIVGYVLKDLASYIYDKLHKYNINYSRTHFSELFNQNEKRNYFQSAVGHNHEHDFKPHPHFSELQNCECGELKFGGLTYDVKQPEVEKKDKSTSSKPDVPPTPPTNYLRWVRDNSLAIKEYCMELIDKHDTDPEAAEAINSALPKGQVLGHLIEEQKALRAKIYHMVKQSDFRQRIGEFEKIKAILAQTVINLSKVAAVLDISPKHLSKNVLQNLGVYKENMKWFKAIQIPIVKDMKRGETLTIDNFADWYNLNLKRKDIPGLDMVQLNVY